MAWVVFDRAVRLAEQFELDAPLDRWKQARDEIHREVCERGYDSERRTFTQYYGSRSSMRPRRLRVALFDRLIGLSNDLGLLAEEYDVARGRQVGNFPQAFSHLTLIGAAMAIATAEARAEPEEVVA